MGGVAAGAAEEAADGAADGAAEGAADGTVVGEGMASGDETDTLCDETEALEPVEGTEAREPAVEGALDRAEAEACGARSRARGMRTSTA